MVFKYVFLVLFLLFLLSVFENYQAIANDIDFHSLIRFGMASLIVALVYWLFLRRRLSFFENFVHETTHLVFALLCLRWPEGLTATRAGGGVFTYRGKKNFLISLAPYFFPVFTAFLIAISFVIKGQFLAIAKYLVVISYAWHLISFARQFKLSQNDISETGKLFSCIFVLGMNVLITLLVIYYLIDDLEGYCRLLEFTIRM